MKFLLNESLLDSLLFVVSKDVKELSFCRRYSELAFLANFRASECLPKEESIALIFR